MSLHPPGFIEPCLPTGSRTAPTGPQWAYEIKHDGFRFICHRDGERVRVSVQCRLRKALIASTIGFPPTMTAGAATAKSLLAPTNEQIAAPIPSSPMFAAFSQNDTWLSDHHLPMLAARDVVVLTTSGSVVLTVKPDAAPINSGGDAAQAGLAPPGMG